MSDHTLPEAMIQLDMPLSADEAELIRKAAPAIRAAERERIAAMLRVLAGTRADDAADLIESETQQ